MDLVVRAFPLVPGREEELRDFARELLERRQEAADFFRRYGVAHESWHLQTTPHGTWVIGVTQVADQPVAVAAREYAASERPFDRWFKDRIHRLSGINPDEQPLGPPTACLLDTRELFAGEAADAGPAAGGLVVEA